LPFLQFTRDKRGYETTSLVDAGRRNGRSHPRILYWFRTPPGVKVGRPALDPETMRWIEEHNPDIEFDWPKILEAQPSPAPPPDDSRVRRQRRDRPRTPPPAAARRPDTAAEGPRPPAPEVESSEAASKPPEPALELEPKLEPELEREPELEPEPEPELSAAFEQLAHPDATGDTASAAVGSDQPLARDQLMRLRARYAELLTRIAERGGDADRVQGLRAQAESLNPDNWITSDDVRTGVESFEQKIRDLRAALGLRRRRRSRRGGRRRRPDATESAPSAPAGAPEPSSNEGE